MFIDTFDLPWGLSTIPPFLTVYKVYTILSAEREKRQRIIATKQRKKAEKTRASPPRIPPCGNCYIPSSSAATRSCTHCTLKNRQHFYLSKKAKKCQQKPFDSVSKCFQKSTLNTFFVHKISKFVNFFTHKRSFLSKNPPKRHK